MGCITKLLELKGDKDFIASPVQPEIIVEGGGTYKEFEYLVVLNHNAHRCGYVAIPKEHPAYNAGSYDDIDVEVHGGLTFFSEPHIVESTCEDKWAGFDAGHAYDGHDIDAHERYFGSDDSFQKYMRSRPDYYPIMYEGTVIRDFDYMESECKRMIDQLEKIQKDTA
jgi:hypothetical protein